MEERAYSATDETLDQAIADARNHLESRGLGGKVIVLRRPNGPVVEVNGQFVSSSWRVAAWSYPRTVSVEYR